MERGPISTAEICERRSEHSLRWNSKRQTGRQDNWLGAIRIADGHTAQMTTAILRHLSHMWLRAYIDLSDAVLPLDP